MPRLDLPFLAAQAGLMVSLAFVGLGTIAGLSSKRRSLMPPVVGCAVAGWLAVILAIVSGVWRWGPEGPPCYPAAIGPSAFALWDAIAIFGLALWFPTLIVWLLSQLVCSWRGVRIHRTLAVSGCILYAVLGASMSWWMSLEDTLVAPGFSWRAWERVRIGMTRSEVESTLGSAIPEPFRPAFASNQEAECWVSNWSAGYFAAVWFVEGRAVRKLIWYSD